MPKLIQTIPGFYKNAQQSKARNNKSAQKGPALLSNLTSQINLGSTLPIGTNYIFYPFSTGSVGGVWDYTWLNPGHVPSASSGSISIEGIPDRNVLLGSNNEVTFLSDDRICIDCAGFKFSAGSALLAESGKTNLIDGSRIFWGRWEKDFSVTDQGTLKQSLGSFHYMYSPDITPMSAVFNTATPLTGGIYNYAGGTAPTNQNGITGTISGAALNVNFAQQLISFNISTNIAGVSLSGEGSGTIQNFILKHIPLSGVLQGKASGLFVGPTAGGAITSFDLSDGSNTASGTALFKR